MKFLVVAVQFALLFSGGAGAAPDQADLSAQPGGKISIRYGAPTWKPEWDSQIVDGMIWRLGSNPPTTLSTQAGLIFEDCVIFPGEYNLGVICRNSEEWDLVVHHDGLNYLNGPHEGLVRFLLQTLPEEQASQRLQIGLERAEQHYLMRITLGRRNLEKAFLTAPGKSLKGKVGKHKFTSTYLERTDLEAVAEKLVEDEVCVCRIDSPDLKHPVRAFLRGGELVELMIEPAEGWRAPLSLKGQSGPAKTRAKKLVHALESGKDSAQLTFTVAELSYHFDLPAALFAKE